MNFEEKYRKYKNKYLNLCGLQKGGVKSNDPPNTTKFDNVTLGGKSNKRLIKELRQIFDKYDDVTYEKNIINIPSNNIKVTIQDKFPFGDVTITFNDISYVANWSPIGYNIVYHIGKIIDGDKNDFKMIISLLFFMNGKIEKKSSIALDNVNEVTVDKFVNEILQEHYDKTTHYISHLRFGNNGDVIYSPTEYYKNKKICDIITSSFLDIFVDVAILLSEDDLINFMNKTRNLTTNLSPHKIVSTPETTGVSSSIIRYHLNLYKNNVKHILKNVFGQDGVCIKYSYSKFNPVIFYVYSYLNKFADKLKRLKKFKDIENLPDYILIQLGNIIRPNNNLLYTLMLILFGDIDNIKTTQPNFIPDPNVLELYTEYLEETTP